MYMLYIETYYRTYTEQIKTRINTHYKFIDKILSISNQNSETKVKSVVYYKEK